MLPFLLILLSAALYVLSFPPYSLMFLAWGALVPFFVAVSRVPPWSAALYGMLLTLVAGVGAAWWCPAMLVDYLGVSLAVGWSGLLAVILCLAAGYYAAFAAWLSWMTQHGSVHPLLVAAAWGVCEFARASLFIGNPWALLAYSQISQVWLIQIADLAGPYGISMVIVAVNARLAGVWVPAFRGRYPVRSWGAVIALFCAVVGYGQWRLAQPFGEGEPVQVAVVQGGIERRFRWNAEHRQSNLDRYLALTKEAATTQPQLIFWPEYAIEFFLQQPSPLREALFTATREQDIELILGGPSYRYGETFHHYHNSVFLIRRGRIAGRYDKSLLVPIAEQRWLGMEKPGKRSRYEGGPALKLLRTGVGQVGAFVCFESMYPALVRHIAGRGAEILANPSNDDWFGHAIPSQYQLDIALLRAVENRRYLVRPTTTGFSAIVDPHGYIIARSHLGSSEVLTATIKPARTLTLYQWWGDALCWLALGSVLVASLFRWRAQSNETTNRGAESTLPKSARAPSFE